jgi:acetyl esterase/lipase
MHAEEFLSRVDPEILPALLRLPVFDLQDVDGMRREQRELYRAAARPLSGDVATEDFWVVTESDGDQVLVRSYRPTGSETASLPCVFWVHGGGHVRGSVELDEPVVEQLVLDVGCCVLAVEPRLAPESPFPASVEDSMTALVWAFSKATELGIDAGRIAVGGASSGGGVAAALCLLARDRTGLPICFQWLVYPMLDDRNVSQSSFQVEDPRLWNRESNLLAWSYYLGDIDRAGQDVSPYAAPARMPDLSRLPPTLIQTGELDLFRDEDLDYGHRLRANAVPTEILLYPGAVHGFDRISPEAQISSKFRSDRNRALREVFLSSGISITA